MKWLLDIKNYNEMKKKYLCVAAGISHASVEKLGKTKMLPQVFSKNMLDFTM